MNGIDVKIQYRRFGSDEWHLLQLTPEEYFELEVNEIPSLESIPVHNHIIEYIGVEASKIRNTMVLVSDAIAKKSYSISEVFWNDGLNRVIERVDKDLISDVPQVQWELIVNTVVASEDVATPGLEVLRLSRESGFVVPTFHGFYKRNQDGSEVETKVRLNTTDEG